jgi:hypothetical protein
VTREISKGAAGGLQALYSSYTAPHIAALSYLDSSLKVIVNELPTVALLSYRCLVDDYFKNTSAYGQGKLSIAVSPSLVGVQADLWDSPPAGSMIGSGIGSVTAGLVDCAKGFEQCTGAKVGVNPSVSTRRSTGHPVGVLSRHNHMKYSR